MNPSKIFANFRFNGVFATDVSSARLAVRSTQVLRWASLTLRLLPCPGVIESSLNWQTDDCLPLFGNDWEEASRTWRGKEWADDRELATHFRKDQHETEPLLCLELVIDYLEVSGKGGCWLPSHLQLKMSCRKFCRLSLKQGYASLSAERCMFCPTRTNP